MHSELVCTYRLQLCPAFGFAEAARIIGYLRSLGVSHVYLSPLLQAGPNSEHGYDIADPTSVDERLGGEPGLRKLFDQLAENGMAAVLDIVPNHLAAILENPWWRDVLERGQASPHAGIFDINWDAPEPELKGRVLLPFLGGHLGKVVSEGEITIETGDASPVLRYSDRDFPINEAGLDVMREGGGLTDILDCQFYRLVDWRLAGDEINYRRFFSVAGLVGIRAERPEVFAATHGKLLQLLESGPVDGFRVDHPDGLRDPAGYFRELRKAVGGELWVVAEKILGPAERLPEDWLVEGTTGYDFLRRAGGLFIDPAGEKPLSDFYADYTSRTEPYGELVRERKRRVLERSFGSDLARLANLLKKICSHPSIGFDFSRRKLRVALAEVLSNFPIYRTYVGPERGQNTPADREAVTHALAYIRRHAGESDADLLDLLETILSGDPPPGVDATEFIARFQQLSVPVMAKGVEDTTFYCYDRMLALNDVGCDPTRFGVSVDEFHEANSLAHRDWPRAMLTTSTHDTKRGEDVRARLSFLSEIPPDWAKTVRIWSHHNRAAWQGRQPDRSAEHLLYQTLVGTWPITHARIAAYMLKACREAKEHTSWDRPDECYEAGIREFIQTVMNDAKFVEELENFSRSLAVHGRVNSLAQTLLKLTCPGIPDIYQGCEVFDDSLVDPDNRRAVDFTARSTALEELAEGMETPEIMRRAEKGFPKLHVIRQTLALRRRLAHNFGPGPAGAYQPLLVSGARLAHAVAFRRGTRIAVVVPRLVHGLQNGWEDTIVALGEGTWTNVMDGASWKRECVAS